MSRRVSTNKKSVRGCKHCQNMGEQLHVWTSHNTVDVSGRVCCPKILANVCSKCNVRGHLLSRCTGRPDILRQMAFVFRQAKPLSQPKVDVKSSCGGFDALVDYDSSPDASPRTPVKLHHAGRPWAPVAPTKSLAQCKASEMDWSVESDDEDAPPANVTIRSKVMRSWADDEDW